jgi:GNAT superfamily N-acetyltransferase
MTQPIRSLRKSDREAYVALLERFRPSHSHSHREKNKNKNEDNDDQSSKESASLALFDAAFDKAMDNGHIWVASAAHTSDEGERLIGTITVHVEQKFIHHFSRYARVEDLFVLPEWRGLGVATALLDTAERYCSAQNIRKVSLTCSDDLVAFYEARGFSTRQNDLSVCTMKFKSAKERHGTKRAEDI